MEKNTNTGFLSTIRKYNSYLGQGSFGVVLKVVDNQNNLSAVKFLFPDGNEIERNKFLRECTIPSALNPHSNIVAIKSAEEKHFTAKELEPIFDVLNTDQTDSYLKNRITNRLKRFQTIDVICIQSELCGENLRKWLKDHKALGGQSAAGGVSILVQLQQVKIAQNLITGLKYLHDNKIIHRDLKPENIMFSNANYILPIKIGDFGLCRKYHSDASQTNAFTTGVGTGRYMAPEIRLGKDYNHQADFYSLGLIIWEVVQFVDALLFERLVYDDEKSLVKTHDMMPGVEEIIINLTKRKPEERIKNLATALKTASDWNVIKNKKISVQTSEELSLCLRFYLEKCEIVLLGKNYIGPFCLRGDRVTLSGNNALIVMRSYVEHYLDIHGTLCNVSKLRFVAGAFFVSGSGIGGTAVSVTGDNNILKNLEICNARDGIVIKSKNNCVDQDEMSKILNHGIDVYQQNNTISNISGKHIFGFGIVLHGFNNSLANVSFVRTNIISKDVKDFIGVWLIGFGSKNVISNLTVSGCREESKDFGLVVDGNNCGIKQSKCGPIRVLGNNTTLTNVDCGELLIVGKGAEGVKISKCRGNKFQALSPIMVEDCYFG